jgi:16S rRNA (adenine1518-N6/adenine1519-N6)-dimethyltransferase
VTATRTTLRERGIFPYKGRGQHFLVNDAVAERIVEVSLIAPDDVVVEIGPGTGALTARLVGRAKRIIAVESDKKLYELIREKFASTPLEVVFGDALAYDYRGLAESAGKPLVVVANLPYNISTPMIFRLLETGGTIKRIVLMLQREVAQRLTASPGTKEYGALTVAASRLCEISIAFGVGRGNFHPVPKVDSAVVVFSVRDRPYPDVGDAALFGRVVRAAFGGRRKTLRNALKPLLGPDASDILESIEAAAGVDLSRRGETLSVEEFARLADAVGAVTAGR